MAKRRNRITHQADLAEPTDTVSAVWNISDEWQLMLWLMIVPAFYYKMRIALGMASDDERRRYDWIGSAMQAHHEFGNQLLNFPKLVPEDRIEALKEIANTCNRIVANLKGETQS